MQSMYVHRYVAVHKTNSMRFIHWPLRHCIFWSCAADPDSVFGRSAGDKAETEHQGLTSGATQQPSVKDIKVMIIQYFACLILLILALASLSSLSSYPSFVATWTDGDPRDAAAWTANMILPAGLGECAVPNTFCTHCTLPKRTAAANRSGHLGSLKCPSGLRTWV